MYGKLGKAQRLKDEDLRSVQQRLRSPGSDSAGAEEEAQGQGAGFGNGTPAAVASRRHQGASDGQRLKHPWLEEAGVVEARAVVHCGKDAGHYAGAQGIAGANPSPPPLDQQTLAEAQAAARAAPKRPA
jgi:hypothetical protein